MNKVEWRAEIDRRLAERFRQPDGPRISMAIHEYFQRHLECWIDVASDLLAEKLADDS